MVLTVGSLFSGIGGIELGFERTGMFETKWFCESDLYAQAVLKKHWPGKTIYDDITKVDWETVESVDVLTGGFPCQDISNAGKRIGITGSRSGLWKYYLEAIRALRPRYAVIENVSALTQRGLDVILSDLAEARYDAEWFDIRASDVGAPHRRERIFIIAYPNCVYVRKQHFYEEERINEKTDLFNVSNSSGCGFEKYMCENRKTGTKTSIMLSGSRQWQVEPCVGRVAHGVPNWVDRIKCLGNTVVPQVAEVVAQKVIEKERFR